MGEGHLLYPLLGRFQSAESVAPNALRCNQTLHLCNNNTNGGSPAVTAGSAIRGQISIAQEVHAALARSSTVANKGIALFLHPRHGLVPARGRHAPRTWAVAHVWRNCCYTNINRCTRGVFVVCAQGRTTPREEWQWPHTGRTSRWDLSGIILSFPSSVIVTRGVGRKESFYSGGASGANCGVLKELIQVHYYRDELLLLPFVLLPPPSR